MSSDHGESDVAPTESKTTGTIGNFPHGSRETPATSVSLMEADRSEKARGHKSDMDVGCGVGGGKGTDEGEHRAVVTGADTGPETERETVGSQVARIAGCT